MDQPELTGDWETEQNNLSPPQSSDFFAFVQRTSYHSGTEVGDSSAARMQWEVVRAGSRGHSKALPAAVGHFVIWDCGPTYTHALVSSL